MKMLHSGKKKKKKTLRQIEQIKFSITDAPEPGIH